MNWIVGAVVVLIAAMLFDMDLLAYAMYVLLAVIFSSRFLAKTWADSLSAERTCNRSTANIGDKVAISLSVRNNGSLPIAWVLLEDLLPRRAIIHDPPNLAIEGRRVALSMLKPNGEQSILYQLKCNRRGYYQLGPLVLETGDLFGLHRRYRVATKPNFLLVYPEVIPLEGYEVSSRRPIGEVKMTYRLFEDPTRIAGVRAYQAGDPMNRVNWKATARTGELHSKVYEPSSVAGATILLDFHGLSHPAKDEPYRSELAITATASLANAVYEMGQQVGLVTNGRDAADRIRQEGWDHDIRTREEARKSASMLETDDRLQPLEVPTARGADQFLRILESLARLELTDGLNLPELIAETSSRLPRDATVIAVLPTVDEMNAIALGNLKRSGYAVAAIVNTYDEYQFAQMAGLLIAQGIEVFQLKNETQISTMCRRILLKA